MQHPPLSTLRPVMVPFEAYKCPSGRVIYVNNELHNNLDESQILSQYNYITSNEYFSKTHTNGKVFFAERYGGDGILDHGGGARCGYDGVWQLKGIGVNPLLGKKGDRSHNNGFLCVSTAIYESIWAEIVHIALPFGAARTVAIIDTDIPFQDSERPTTRGLLVREPVVRPAHFLRSLYFKETSGTGLCPDAQRVRAAIRRLVHYLPRSSPWACQSSTQPTCDSLRDGLLELAKRYAKQFAVARARRIIHCNVSASNVAMDGGWLDLSGSCLFSQLLKPDKVDVERFETEFQPALESIRGLCYYLFKYNVLAKDRADLIFSEVLNSFNTHYGLYLKIYEVERLGFPLWVVMTLSETNEFKRLAAAFTKTQIIDNYSTFTRTASWSGYQSGLSVLCLKLLDAKIAKEPHHWNDTRSLPHEVSIELTNAYSEFYECAVRFAATRSIDRQNFSLSVALNTVRLNKFHASLVNPTQFIADISSTNNHTWMFNHFRDMATLSLTSNNELFIHCWKDDSISLHFNCKEGIFLTNMKDIPALTLQDWHQRSNRDGRFKSASDFYAEIWIIFRDQLPINNKP